jgi:hypothetical protein
LKQKSGHSPLLLLKKDAELETRYCERMELRQTPQKRKRFDEKFETTSSGDVQTDGEVDGFAGRSTGRSTGHWKWHCKGLAEPIASPQ